MLLHTEVGLVPGDIVSDGDPAPPNRGQSPQFSARVCCGQTVGPFKKLPLGTEVGLGPGHIMLDGELLPRTGVQQPPPLFGPCLL